VPEYTGRDDAVVSIFGEPKFDNTAQVRDAPSWPSCGDNGRPSKS
jgi:hypothetical protein